MADETDLSAFSMVALFRAEVEEHASVLSAGLLELEREPAAEELERMMRAAHSIKGGARIVGLDTIVRLSHVMEDCLVAVQGGRLALAGGDIDLMLSCVDLMNEIPPLEDDAVPVWVREHQQRIEALVTRVTAIGEESGKASEPEPAPTSDAEPAGGFGSDAMFELFRGATEDHVETLTAGIDRMAKGEAVELESLVETTHALRGEARIVQVDPVARLADAVGAWLAGVETRGDQRQSADLLGPALEILRGLARVRPGEIPIWVGEREKEIGRLVAEIEGAGEARDGGAKSGARRPSKKEGKKKSVVGKKKAAAEKKPPKKPGKKAKPKASKKATEKAGDASPDSAPPSPSAISRSPEPAQPTKKPKQLTADQDLSAFSLYDLFRAEADSQVVVLSDGLIELEQDADNAELIEGLMRAAHSIKGAARVVELEPAVELAHAMEDCFVAAQESRLDLGEDSIDLLLAGVDVLTRMAEVDEAEAPAWLAASEEQIGELAEAMRGVVRGEQVAIPIRPEQFGGSGLERASEVPESDQPEAVAESAAPVAAAGPEAPSRPAPVRAGPKRPDAPKGREIKITAENLDRLMGLAGESLVEARWLDPFAASLLKLKKAQEDLSETLDLIDVSRLPERQGLRIEGNNRAAKRQLADCRRILGDRMNELDTFSRRSANLSSRLYRAVIESRMRPFEDGVRGFRRLIRDLARRLDKRARLEITGLATEVDRDILDKLEAPLNHLLRNAADHGLEDPAARVAAGKPEEGTIVLDACHRSGRLVITVTDDGRGIEFEPLRKKIIERELAGEEMVARMGESELLDFLFLAGFSTAGEVTEISGRGVGLDVVQTMIQEVGGVLRAASRPGQGMTFTLELPLTRSVMRTLLVEVQGEPFAINLARIDHTLQVPQSDLKVVENRQYYPFDGANIGLVAARQVLEMGVQESEPDDLFVVVLSDQMNRYGLVVDRLLGEQDLVIRPLDPRLGKVPDVAAVAVLPDGAPVLIIDVDDVVRSVDNLLSGRRLRKVGRTGAASVEKKAKRILVVDDSITVREVERKILKAKGYEVDVAVDGMDGWNAIRTGSFDLVISDIDMPRMTGFELVETVRAAAHFEELPIVIVSYKDREEDRLRGLEAGANYYLTKGSFQDDGLVRAVVDLIGPAVS